MDKTIQQILDDPNEWANGEWELSFQLPLASVEPAARSLLTNGKLTGWWEAYGPGRRVFPEQIRLVDLLREGGIDLKGAVLLGGLHVACLFIVMVPKISEELPRETQNTRDGIVLLQIPSPSLDRASEWDGEGEPIYVLSLMNFFKELALEICHRFPVLLCMLGHGVTCSEKLKVSDLYSHTGYILPKDHALANSPGGVPFLENYVLFDWNLTQDSDGSVKG